MNIEHSECPQGCEVIDGPHEVDDGDGETVVVPEHALL
jgi:hypothetical protein